MNLRQRYKKAKQKLAIYDSKTINPVIAEETELPIETLAVKRIVPYNDINCIDSIKQDIAKQLFDEMLKKTFFESYIDEFTGNIVIQAKLRIVNDK